jgi:hypothetical protein
VNVIQVEIASSEFSSQLISLVEDITSGKEVGGESSWLESFFSQDLSNHGEACIAIHEGFLADWIFTDHDLLENFDGEAEAEEVDVTDQARLAHAREQLKGLNESFPEFDAPSIYFVDLLDGQKKCCSLIIGIIPAGQMGLITTLESAFLEGDHRTELAETGFIDLEALENLDDQWILDRWTRQE